MSKLLVLSILLLSMCLTISSQSYGVLFPGALQCTEALRAGNDCFIYNYVPALGFTQNYKYKLYGNECDACKDPEVIIYWNFRVCTPDMPSGSLRVPYCVVTGEKKLIQFDTLDEACKSDFNVFFLKGQCPPMI
jgi:hypothetical protein